ncbi:poly-beta-1,6-N-acetyl-D-glucosamine biosynthesis protein PgaD [Solimicrobium silvestre]|uniref:Poly-beta-1,6-N-acetyl-D-glucosamine biosynthesis protein PgaD n=1 Tax=Solimicrobium silvestre TaxID=2099400 RepID=A0A2S9GSB5_9BURK|nr:poly-beta-1,6-N-acetyl-D-glucosamine biosynthesis protein PgaD [Solimicrobium silvestre]PRC90600.1 Poly-beta-1,6-N-acetyl-D-glucosamine biosynthesis protein PgaD [Solimicrobium silvestre]
MKTLIFENPELAPLPNRIGWTFFTTFFWIVWVYLWMPLITLVIWALGFNYYDDHFLHNSPSELLDLRNLLVFYLSIIVTLGGSLLLWARTEYMRFRNVHRRTRPLPVAIEDLAEFSGVKPEIMAKLSTVKHMIAHHDEHGKFLYADFED